MPLAVATLALSCALGSACTPSDPGSGATTDTWVAAVTSGQNSDTAPIGVTLRDAVQPDETLAEAEIDAYQITNLGYLIHRQRRITDRDGRAEFALAGLGQGRAYLFKTRHYSKSVPAYSEPVFEPGEIDFLIGTVRVSVIDFSAPRPAAMPDTRVTIYELFPDGYKAWFARMNTDSAGVLRLDLPGLGRDSSYLLAARNPTTRQYKKSQVISEPGQHEFRVGNRPLALRLVDASSDQPLAGVRVTARELLGDGTSRWAAQRISDDGGQVIFDLDGLGDGREYYVTARAHNEFRYRSPVFTEPGEHDLELGAVVVRVLDGSDRAHPPLADKKVHIYQKRQDGKLKWYGRAYTDRTGIVRIDLPGLESHATEISPTYVLRARSTVTGQYKSSQDITKSGEHNFVVGNLPLHVTVRDGIAQNVLTGEKVTAYEIISPDQKKWRASGTTDENGQVRLDLDGLTDNPAEPGRTYRLGVRLEGVSRVYSPDVTGPGDVEFLVATSPVTLIDGSTGQPLGGVRLTAYTLEIDQNGTPRRNWYKHGTTDANGRVPFDFEVLRAPGQPVVVRANDPFRKNQRYFSQLIRRPGSVKFVIRDGEDRPFDYEPPHVAITAPADSQRLSHRGAVLTGVATDNHLVASISVEVSDRDKGVSQGPAEFDSATGEFRYTIPEQAITAGATATVKVTARDRAENSSSVTRSYSVVRDADRPVVAFLSHKNGDSVARQGLVLRGSAVDNIGVAELHMTVALPDRGITVDRRPLRPSGADGRWAAALWSADLGGELTPDDRPVVITIEATDREGNRGTASIDLKATELDREPYRRARHVLDRLTFGASPELLAEFGSIESETLTGHLDRFIERQLGSDPIDQRECDAGLGQLPAPGDGGELADRLLARMVSSERQLREVMTWFWENHFNTDLRKHKNTSYELVENRAFCRHALGNFRDLLEASATSPAMIVYLDSAVNSKDNPNENYAREILELHTMGVDGGYTRADVAALARVFSGWHLRDGRFFFDADEHDDSDKTFLGRVIPGAGVEEGMAVLDILTRHQATATHISKKLLQLFVSDDPSPDLVSSTAEVFMNPGDGSRPGEITPVLKRIFRSAEFWAAANRRAKIKTPLEFVLGAARAFHITPDGHELTRVMHRLGMDFLEFPVPTGYPEVGGHWINTNSLFERVRAAHDLAHADSPDGLSADPRAFALAHDRVTAEGITELFLAITHGGEYTEDEFRAALSQFGPNRPFDIDLLPDADEQVRRVLAAVLGFPGNQYQ